MLETILAAYPADCHPENVQTLGNAGGFSGARIWKLTAPVGELCVRQWPAKHPTLDGLRWIHQVLAHVDSNGFRSVPVPIKNSSGDSFLLADRHFWELAPWMPGEADFRQHPSRSRLIAAMEALARFHLAAASMQCEPAVSRGLQERFNFAERLVADGELIRWRTTILTCRDDPRFEPCQEILELASPLVEELPRQLKAIVESSFPIQPCLRDIWHDHVLFQDDVVSGLIDFGAMRMETVAVDIARLLGSLVEDDADQWQSGMAAYERVRPMPTIEWQAVKCLDRANIALSGLNWLRWLMIDQKTFDNCERVDRRLEDILRRLRNSGKNRGFRGEPNS